MGTESEKTIYTISDASDYKGLTIVKISGNKSVELAKSLTKVNVIQTNEINHLSIYNPFTKEFIDKCYILNFSPIDSFTGESMIEIHLHNNKTILTAFKSAICNFSFLEKGGMEDFLRRRERNKNINRLQLKAVDILASHPDTSNKKEALYFLTTNFYKLYSTWYEQIAQLLALIDQYKSSNKVSYKTLDYLNMEIDKITNEITTHFSFTSRFLDSKTYADGEPMDNVVYINKYYEAYTRLLDISLENEEESIQKAILTLKSELEKLLANNTEAHEGY